MVSTLPTTVTVRPASLLAAHRRLFAALEAAFPVRFEGWHPGPSPAGGLMVTADQAMLPAVDQGRAAVPTLMLAPDPPVSGAAGDVVLSSRPPVDRRLRGVVLHGHVPVQVLEPGPADAEHAVLAAAPAGAVWTRAPGPFPLDRVGATLPELGDAGVLRDALAVPRALALVAIVHFLRALCGDSGWTAPPQRAAFIFDDPNLRRPRYGYIDYRKLVRHATTHGYHASMAMIPLDAGRAHPRAVATFRERPDRLSLVIHGNDHSRRELMRPRHVASALALGAQALRRVARFETRTGLRVDRVMTPPHGMCSRTVTEALGALGYDALCAIHPAPWTERPPADRLLAGWNPADFSEGCAVIPRFPLSCSATEIALRAFLGHPLLLYGHHEDVASGLEPLAESAKRVARLGDVQWMSLGEIVLGNHAVRLAGGTAVVRPWGGRVRVVVPPGATHLTVEPPSTSPDCAGLRGWSVGGLAGGPLGFGVPLELDGEERTLTIRVHPRWEVDPGTVPATSRRPWPILRRSVTVARDRMMPIAGSRGRG